MNVSPDFRGLLRPHWPRTGARFRDLAGDDVRFSPIPGRMKIPVGHVYVHGTAPARRHFREVAQISAQITAWSAQFSGLVDCLGSGIARCGALRSFLSRSDGATLRPVWMCSKRATDTMGVSHLRGFWSRILVPQRADLQFRKVPQPSVSSCKATTAGGAVGFARSLMRPIHFRSTRTEAPLYLSRVPIHTPHTAVFCTLEPE